MTVYVDQPFKAIPKGTQAKRHGTVWCHMIADTHDELLVMIARLWLKPGYVRDGGTHREHIDLIPSKRAQAVRYGAVEITGRELVQKMEAKRAAHAHEHEHG